MCAEELFSVAALAIQSAAPAGGVSVPVPTIVGQTSIFDSVNQAIQQAGDCVALTDPTCAAIVKDLEVKDQGSIFDFVNQIDGQAVQEAENCLSQTDPTCALVIRTAQQEAQAIEAMAVACLTGTSATCTQLGQLAINAVLALITLTGQCAAGQDPTCAQVVQTAEQEAQSIETLVTSCVSGTDGSLCSQLEGLATAEINALVTLANQCVGGQDPTCNALLPTVSQLLGEAVTCAVGPLGPAAPSTLPNPLVLPDSSAGDGSGLPDLTVTCQQVKDAAAQLTAGCESGSTAECGPAIAEVEKSPCLNSSDVVACAQASAEPPAPVLPDADPETTFPAGTLGGSLQLGNGAAVADVSIEFYVQPANSLADSAGDSGTIDKLGEVTTDSSGNFSFTLPALDAYAISVANANGGYLNVFEFAVISAAIPNSPSTPSVMELAQADVPMKVGGSPDYWMRKPTVLIFQPIPTNETATNTLAETALPVPQTYDPTDSTVDPTVNYVPTNANLVTADGVPVSADAYNPWVINGVDYRSAVPVSSSAAVNGRPSCDAGVYLMDAKVIKTLDQPVIVGESHAYWDSYAQFKYGQTATSTIQLGYSYDAKKWSLGGEADISQSNGAGNLSDSYGPFWGHQFTERFHFTDTRLDYECDRNEAPQTEYFTEYQVSPTECKFHLSVGKDVSRYDGGDHYAYSPQSYRDTVENGVTDYVTQGSGYHYGAAFNAFGASFGASAGHSTDMEQIIRAGKKAHGSIEHDIWGNNTYWSKAQITYSY